MQEITLIEISEMTGISENQLKKNWKQYEPRMNEIGISKTGRGSKATYYIEERDNYKLAYDILVEMLIQEYGFNTRTDFNKVIKYLYYVMINTRDKNKFYFNYDYVSLVGVDESNLINYFKKLSGENALIRKDLKEGKFMYLNLDNEYVECDKRLAEEFRQCVINECRRLRKEGYKVDLSVKKDYEKAVDIIKNYDFLEDIYLDNDDLRFYKIAFKEVSDAWQKDLGIKWIKFFPKHRLSYAKDEVFIEMISKAYEYVETL